LDEGSIAMTDYVSPTRQTPANEVEPDDPASTADKPEQKKTNAPVTAMRAFAFALMAAGLMLTGSVATMADAETVIGFSQGEQYLFAMSGTSGALEKDRLTLNNIPLVTFFTDRPFRSAGHLSRDDFLSIWMSDAEANEADPPNASLAVYATGLDASAVVVLMKPELTETGISFTVEILQGGVPAAFKHATLFIDGFGNGGAGGAGGTGSVGTGGD
jgi:hypothetical protein